jgi:hypothetical protein
MKYQNEPGVQYPPFLGKEENIMENKNTGLNIFTENYEYTNKEGKLVKGVALITYIPKPYNPKDVQKVVLKTLNVNGYKDLMNYLRSK